jgi:hypothetical protein
MFQVIFLNEYSTTFSRQQNSRLLHRHFRDVTLLPRAVTEITLSRMTVAVSAIFSSGSDSLSNGQTSVRVALACGDTVT